MDQLQEDKHPEDNNPDTVPLEDDAKDENIPCIEKQNNNSETLCFENTHLNQENIKTENVTSTITDEDIKPRVLSENNNPMEVADLVKVKEEESSPPGEILMETEEKKQEEKKSPSAPKQPHKPVIFSPFNSLKNYGSDDDSVDSSSDSSTSSSSSDESDSSDDGMDEKKGDNDQVGLPKAVVPAPKPEEKQVETKEGAPENREPSKVLNFPTSYRDNDDESSSDTSSDSSTSSSSSTEENEIDHTSKPQPNRPPPKDRDSDGEEKISRPRVKGEIFPEELPALENLDINIDDNVDLKMLGKITSVIRNIAVVHAEFSSPIDQDSMIFLKDRTCIGKVHDIIGPVREPFYTIILDKKHTTITIDTEIYCAPEEKEYTNYVFVNDLKNLKGSDASWEHDIEPPSKFLDFSDDEQERANKKRNKCKNSANGEPNDDHNDRNGKSRNRNRPGPSSTGSSNTRNWRKRDQNRGPNSNATDAPQRSMFACSTQWPPSNGQNNFTSWTPPKPPQQYQQMNESTYQDEYNRLNQMMWPQQSNAPGDMRAPFRPPSNFPQRQPNTGPYQGQFNYPLPGNSFNQAPPQGNSYNQAPPHGNSFNQVPPQGNSFNQGNSYNQVPPQGNSYNQAPPQGNSFNHAPPHGNSFHQSSGNMFNHPPPGNSFNQPPSGNSFTQPPPNQSLYQGPRGSQGPQMPPQWGQGTHGFMRNPPRFSQPPQFPGAFP